MSEHLPHCQVIFAVKAAGAHTSDPRKHSIKAVTWTDADGTKGRTSVTQHES